MHQRGDLPSTAGSNGWSGSGSPSAGTCWRSAPTRARRRLPTARVGLTGHVLATDLETARLAELAKLPQVEVRRHDLRTEDLPTEAQPGADQHRRTERGVT